MDLGGGALGGMGGGGGGKSGGGGGGGMTDPMSGMGMGGDSSFGGGGLSDLAGGGSPFGFGETSTSYGGNIASQAQAAQDPTGSTGAQQSIEASQPSPGTPGGGIGGTQTGPQSLGQLAQGTGEPMGSPSQPFSVPTTAVQSAQAPTTPIPGSQPTAPAGGVTPTPTPTPPFGASGAGAFGGPPSDFASQFRSDVNQINLQNPEQPLQSAINQTMPGTADVGGPDQPAAAPTPTPAPLSQDQAASAAGVPREPPTTPDLVPPSEQPQTSNVAAKSDRLDSSTFAERFQPALDQPLDTIPQSLRQEGLQKLAEQFNKEPTFANIEKQYETPTPSPAEKPPAAPAAPKRAPTAAPRTAAPRTAAPHAAHPAYRTDPYGNTYTTQPGYQPSPMSPLPAYPGPSPQTWPRAAAPATARTAAATTPAPGETPAQAAAANSPQGQAVQQVMNQLPMRTLLQLATAAGLPVPPQLALAMGGQPPPFMTRPTTPTAAAPTATSYAPTTTTSAPAQQAINDAVKANADDTSSSLTRSDPRGLRDYIGLTARKYGIDPNVALRVAQSEGLSSFSSGIRGENSWGAFQLNTQGGMGSDFQRETGLNPADPKNEKATIDYALKRASREGWGAFHGAANTGIGRWQGINRGVTANAPPRFSDMGQQLGRENIRTAGPNIAPEQIQREFGGPVETATGIMKATPQQDVERTIRGLEERGASTPFEDERGFEREASDATPRSFAERFPAWANDPNLLDKIVQQRGQGNLNIQPEDVADINRILQIRQQRLWDLLKGDLLRGRIPP